MIEEKALNTFLRSGKVNTRSNALGRDGHRSQLHTRFRDVYSLYLFVRPSREATVTQTREVTSSQQEE